MDWIVTFRTIVEECENINTNILGFFLDFRKTFDIVLRTNLWNRLEELKVYFQLRVVLIKLYWEGYYQVKEL